MSSSPQTPAVQSAPDRAAAGGVEREPAVPATCCRSRGNMRTRAVPPSAPPRRVLLRSSAHVHGLCAQPSASMLSNGIRLDLGKRCDGRRGVPKGIGSSAGYAVG